jgi:hypothetical protein
MTTVPCSIQGCESEGTRWVYQKVRLVRALSTIGGPTNLEIPRFVCDKHSDEFDHERRS